VLLKAFGLLAELEVSAADVDLEEVCVLRKLFELSVFVRAEIKVSHRVLRFGEKTTLSGGKCNSDFGKRRHGR
jgi:hypothetical protein